MLAEEVKQLTRQKLHYRKTSEKLQADVVELQKANANLEGEIGALKWKLAADARSGGAQRREDSRRVGRAEAAAIEERKKAESAEHKAEAQIAAAEARERHAVDVASQEAAKAVSAAEERAEEAELEATQALERATKEETAASSLSKAVKHFREAARQAEVAKRLSQKKEQLLLAKVSSLEEQIQDMPAIPSSRSADEWASLSRQAARKASQREREALRSLLGDHTWRPEDVADVLSEKDLLEPILLRTRQGFRVYFAAVQKLVKQLEETEFGRDFGLLLHFEMHLSLAKILHITQAACKRYDRELNRYVSKPLLLDPWRKDMVVHVPRIAPPRHKLEATLRFTYSQLGVQWVEDGTIAFISFQGVV